MGRLGKFARNKLDDLFVENKQEELIFLFG